jgi:hypothetical protein
VDELSRDATKQQKELQVRQMIYGASGGEDRDDGSGQESRQAGQEEAQVPSRDDTVP